MNVRLTKGLVEVAAFVGEEKSLVRIEIPAIASDARVDRIEQ